MQYEWALKITMELLASDGSVEGTEEKIWPEHNERTARDRYDETARRLADPNRHHPKFQRVGAVELLRRPIAIWETTEKAENAREA